MVRPLAALAACLWPGVSEAACRLALILALDVSGSVDEGEYQFQMTGVASALTDPEVQQLLFAMPDAPVALSIFEWSSASYQHVIQDWVLIETEADLWAVHDRLKGWVRSPAPEATGLGAALQFAVEEFKRGPVCWEQTLDISADGKNNDWPIPERLREAGQLGTMNVNTLVVAPDFLVKYDKDRVGIDEMATYFRERIIHGPGAFVEIALGYSDYGEAMRRKLIRELATVPLGYGPGRIPYRQAGRIPPAIAPGTPR